MRVAAVDDRAFVRLISQTHHKPPVLRGLADSDAEADILAELEGWTSARLIAEREGSPGIDRRELAFARRAHDLQLHDQSDINAAECGAWYCARDTLTAIEEVGFHRTRELQYVGVFDGEARYVELLADFIGDFPDLHGEPGNPALDPDPRVGYPAGQELALALRREGHRGLIYRSVRHAGGICFVAFDPGIIQNVRPGANWKLVWRGGPAFYRQGHREMTVRDPELQLFIDAARDAFLAQTNEVRSRRSLERIFVALGESGQASGLAATRLPVCDLLATAADPGSFDNQALSRLAAAFNGIEPRLGWYRREVLDASASANCADGHANAMIAGPGGLEHRIDVWLGVSLLAPNVRYPDHNHAPEETYLVMSDGEFSHGDSGWFRPGVGGSFYNEPHIVHAMRSGDAPLVAFWALWVDRPQKSE